MHVGHPSPRCLRTAGTSPLKAIEVARLKTRLLCRGLRLTAHAGEGEALGRRSGAGPAEGIFIKLAGAVAQVPTAARFARSSPFELDPEGRLLANGLPVGLAETLPTPSFYHERSPRGTELGKIVQMHGGECVGSTVRQACARKSTGDGCAFCGIGLSLDAGATVLEKTASELAHAARRAREAGAWHMVLTAGSSPGGAPALAEAARAAKAEGLAVQVQLSFPAAPGEIESLAFADSIGIHIESLDERVLAHLAPAKARAGIEGALDSIACAVEVFGRGRVNSFVILGLGERMNPTVRGVERLARLGAYPFLVPLRPVAGTALGGMRPPDPELVERLCLRAAHAIVREGLSWRGMRAGCGRCACCSPVPDFEDALAAGPEVVEVASGEGRGVSRAIRERVFVSEQRIFETTDVDPLDFSAVTLLAGEPGEAVGTVRINETGPGEWLGSRLAVFPEKRGAGAGVALITRAVEEVERRGGVRFRAQIQAERCGLFERLGWKEGATRNIQGRPHVAMEAPLLATLPAKPDPQAIAEAARRHPGVIRKRSCATFPRAFGRNGPLEGRSSPRSHDPSRLLPAARLLPAGDAFDIAPQAQEGSSMEFQGAWTGSFPFAEDAAPIPDGDGYLLLATDGIVSDLIRESPYLAGWSAVMANANDIYATGGRPIAMVNVLATGDEATLRDITRGLAEGARHYGIPMVGGHHHPDAGEPSVSVAIVGRARRLLSSHTARPGDYVIAALDLDGERGCRSVPSWDPASRRDPAELRARLELLPILAEEGLVSAGKDISNGGLLGTIGMLAEASGVGARLWLDGLPVPDGFTLAEWCLCFMSLGFVLTAPDLRAADRLGREGYTAWPVGRITSGGAVEIELGDGRAIVWHFPQDRIMGLWNIAGSNE